MISSLNMSLKKHRTKERKRDMGKYIRRKPKTRRGLAVKDVSQPYLGVHTRSKTKALQLLQSSSIAAAVGSPPAPNIDFLELRSRRLKKTPFIRKKLKNSRKRRAPKQGLVSRDNESSEFESSVEKSCSEPAALPIVPAVLPIEPAGEEGGGSERLDEGLEIGGSVIEASGIESSVEKSCSEPAALPIVPAALPIEPAGEEDGRSERLDEGLEIEASLGENNLELEARESRGTRESTPTGFIRPAVTVTTPGSSTRPRRRSPRAHAGSVTTPGSSTRPRRRSRRTQDVRRVITPTSRELDDFFAEFEQPLQRQFIEKYNFDIVNDMPLPGRYEWEKIEP